MSRNVGNPNWVKGVSGNPGGRPKGIGEVRELARSHTADAIDGLVAIASNPDAPAAARVAAYNSLLDRGWGRPSQMLETTDPGSLVVQIVRSE